MITYGRRDVLKSAMAIGAAIASPIALSQQSEKATVYWTPELSAESLLKMYNLVNANISGKVAIKLHTGEPHGPNILPRDWVKLVQASIPNSTIVECNVLYNSPRLTTKGHRETLNTNGWTFCPVDIMDEDGEMILPVKNGLHLNEFKVGKNFGNYDSMVVLTHFKGHGMGGYGGSLKNIAIGCGSGGQKGGKAQLHKFEDGKFKALKSEFMERMADGAKAITDHFGKKIVYINVLRNMSADCDCAGVSASAPTAPDLGIVASTDLQAVDRACIDIIYALPQFMKEHLVKRIESREGLRQLSALKDLGVGSSAYELIPVYNIKPGQRKIE